MLWAYWCAFILRAMTEVEFAVIRYFASLPPACSSRTKGDYCGIRDYAPLCGAATERSPASECSTPVKKMTQPKRTLGQLAADTNNLPLLSDEQAKIMLDVAYWGRKPTQYTRDKRLLVPRISKP